jgi:cobalt-zinc-cadmium efflux system outer membrane protein
MKNRTVPLLLVLACTATGSTTAAAAEAETAATTSGAAVATPAAVADGMVVPAPRIELTLPDALARAEASPEFVVAQAARTVAENAIAVTQRPLAPTLNTSTHSVTARLGLSLAVPIRYGGQRGSALDVVRAERDAVTAETAAALDRAREQVTAAWFRLAANQELEALATARVTRLDRTSAAVKDLFDAGRVPRVDLVKAQAEAATFRAEVFSASAERRAASAQLAILIGAPAVSEIVAGGERPAPGSVPDLSVLLSRAATAADRRAGEARGRAAAARVRRARREGLPALTLEGGADFDDPTQEGTDKHLSLGLTIPLGARASIAVATAELSRAEAERARLLKSVEADVVATWYRVEGSRRKLEVLERSTLPASKESAELAGVAYREGRLDLLRLLESERALLDVEANRIETWVLWGTQRASLERLVGGTF